MLRNTLQKRLRMECLEEKIALAADLSVSVVDGDLVITGDALPNSFYIEKTDDLGAQFKIQNRGPLGDTINGDTNQVYYAYGVTRDIIINTGEGDDIIRLYGFPDNLDLQNFDVARDLVINSGGGNDQIYLGINEDFGVVETPLSGRVNVGRDLTINGGAGDDLVWTTDLDVVDDLTITDTQGNLDFQNISSGAFLFGDFSYVGDDVSVTTGSGIDYAAVNEMFIGGNVTLSLGGGDDVGLVALSDVGGSVAMSLGGGFNTGQLETTTVGGSVGVIGSGSNVVIMLGVEANSVTVVTANNNDLVQLIGVTTGLATVATFGGADYVEITESAFDLLIVELGAGNDDLLLQNVEVSLLALLSGGRGTDTIDDLGGNDFNLLLDLGFEIFN